MSSNGLNGDSNANSNDNSNNANDNSNNNNEVLVSKHDFENLLKKIKELEEQLDNKVDCEIFDNEIASLRELIGNMEADDKGAQLKLQQVISTPASAQLSAKDVNKLKELFERMP